jgi:tetratricopeptide (TPR) repeat protein
MPIPMRRAARALASVAAVAFCLAGCASDEEKIEQFLGEAQELREERRWREALILLRKALQIDPQDPEINLTIAETYTAMRRPQDAAFFYGEAYRLDPTLTDAALMQAPTLYEGDPDAAKKLIQEVLERDPSNANAFVIRSELELLATDTDAALRAALTASELAPEDPRSQRAVGTVYRSIVRERLLGKQPIQESTHEAALAAFRRSDALAGGHWWDRHEIALVYEHWEGHEEEAKQAWRDAFATAREDEDLAGMRICSNSAARYGRITRDPALVRWALEQRIATDPGHLPTVMRLARLADQHDGSGEDVWRAALAVDPADPNRHAAFASYLVQSERRAEALSHLESLDPSLAAHPVVRVRLFETWLADGQEERAGAVLAQMESEDPDGPYTRYAQARIALQAGRAEKAAELLRVLSTEVERADVYLLLSEAELEVGDTDAALRALEQSMALRGYISQPNLRRRLRILTRRADWDAVLETLAEMQRRGHSFDTPERIHMARALYQRGEHVRARRVLEPLFAEDPPNVAAVLIYAQFEAGTNPDRSRELLEAVLVKRPYAQGVIPALVRLDRLQGRSEQALARIDSGTQADSRSLELRLLRTQLLAELGRTQEAERDARALVSDGSEEAPALLARILEIEGRGDEAIAVFEEHRANLRAMDLWNLGRLYLQSGDLPQSRKALEAALERNPQLQVARNDLAYVLTELGSDLDRALELAREAKAAMPDSPAVADTLGWVYYRRGLNEPAVVEFRAAIAQVEDNDRPVPADFHYHLGLALQGLDRTDEARAELARALAVDPEHEGARRAQAELANTSRGEAGS